MRPQHANAAYVHALLKRLEDKAFTYAPRFQGIDSEGREMLSFIEGVVPFGRNDWTNAQLTAAARILRQFHDATAGSDLAQGKETVCHNDFAPWNIILRNNDIVGLIDFDGAAPGDRADDLSYLLWTFLELGTDVATEAQIQKAGMLCHAYGFSDGKKLVKALLGQQERILEMRMDFAANADRPEVREFSAERIGKIQSEIAWVKAHRQALETGVWYPYATERCRA